MNHFVLISGCSGGGKSSLVAELQRRNFAVVEEPGRRIVAQERQGSGQALPWVNPAAFAARAVEMALRDREHALRLPGPVFFDRGLIDAAAALEHATGKPALQVCAAERYHPRVFVTPPWPEIYASDADRRHGLRAATEEYERLLSAFATLGYAVDVLPKVGVAQRADLVLETLGYRAEPSAR